MTLNEEAKCNEEEMMKSTKKLTDNLEVNDLTKGEKYENRS